MVVVLFDFFSAEVDGVLLLLRYAISLVWDFSGPGVADIARRFSEPLQIGVAGLHAAKLQFFGYGFLIQQVVNGDYNCTFTVFFSLAQTCAMFVRFR